MTQTDITDAVFDQFARTLRMFREAVLAFPSDEWRQGDIDYLRPAGVAYHVVESIDFYTGSDPVDKFAWGGRFGVDWEGGQSDQLPTQEQVICYLDEMAERVKRWFEKGDLLSPEQEFPWTGTLVLGRVIYVLRHNQHHLAEMCIELTRRGHPSPGWE